MGGLVIDPRLIDAASPYQLAALIGAGLVAALVGLGFLGVSKGWTRALPWVIGVIGLLAIEAGLYAVRKQTKTTRLSDSFKLTRPRYSDEARTWAVVGQVAAPVLFILAARYVLAARFRSLHDAVPDLVQQGLKHLFHREFNAAVIEFSAAIKIEPDRADLYCKRGYAFEMLREFDLALHDLERALVCNSNLVDAYLRRGSVQTEVGQFDAALADFERVLAVRSNDVECHLRRGICLAKKGRTREAVTALEKVLRLTNDPDFADPARQYINELRTGPDSLPRGPLY